MLGLKPKITQHLTSKGFIDTNLTLFKTANVNYYSPEE